MANEKEGIMVPQPALGGRKRRATRRKSSRRTEEGYLSSGDEYTGDLMETYVGQCGALAGLGVKAEDVFSVDVWENRLTESEREHLRRFLPPGSRDQRNKMIRKLLTGEDVFFGNPREKFWNEVVSGCTHPRVRRWKQRVILIQKKHYLLSMREYMISFRNHVLAMKNALTEEDVKALTIERPSQDGQYQAAQWDEERKRCVENFRKQEEDRYSQPERAYKFEYRGRYGIVAPLKRGPLARGARPREHPLLKSDRPSCVTILSLVRDAACRLDDDKGSRNEIIDLLKDSQYLAEDVEEKHLGAAVSGALDRLNSEDDPCVRYINQSKLWQYIHNDRDLASFAVPAWAAKVKRTRRRRAQARSSSRRASMADEAGADEEDDEVEEDGGEAVEVEGEGEDDDAEDDDNEDDDFED
eukprot:CAMPEP_0184695214 /NCGR_PEP_ID=MMETSP0313-20130426/2924_1 /TAXON_ID=2792 /ORGANISM="Porphyridium aerugineum, Strain SAG 1380-2" /LENGTH=412 /DNA_ID=CAMNT_0027153629 /DNA_START=66 /DNA_END=1304 /DNA_ORIENTATION=+